MLEIPPSLPSKLALKHRSHQRHGNECLAPFFRWHCGKLALSDDGTLVTFVGFVDGSAATPDETFILNRAAATLNSTNQLFIGLSYINFAWWQPGRRPAPRDDVNWIIADKGGL